MDWNLGYLHSEYARNKDIECYDIEASWREKNDCALNIITGINEQYKKIHGIQENKGAEAATTEKEK